MSYEEICSLLEYNNKESKVFISNDVFEILKSSIDKAPHIAFSYSYNYLITWLFRYTKYFNLKELIDNKKMKQILGYTSTNQTVDYLIKKNGLLDEIGISLSSRDYPLYWTYDNANRLSFSMRSEHLENIMKYLPEVPKRYFCKHPLLALGTLNVYHKQQHIVDGSYFNIENTHMIPFEVFAFCMSKDEIGCTGFYLYSYLSHQNDISHKNETSMSLKQLADKTKLSERSVSKYIDTLKRYRMLDFTHNMEFYLVDAYQNQKKANTYKVRDYYHFSSKPLDYERIKVKTVEQYDEIKKANEEITKFIQDSPLF